jgi:2,6-dihydroxypyridine 3-monooxygenase
MSWPKVIIAGGSIGGLTTALLLSELGCEVDVYERSASQLEDRGTGIVVLPITERYFTENRARQSRVSLELGYWTYVDSVGNIIDAHPVHTRFSAWSTIYRALLGAFDGDHYHLDSEVSGFREHADAVTIHMTNGATAEGDLLIFADGLSSTGRSILLPEIQPSYVGYVAWRGTTPERVLSQSAQDDLADSMIYQVLDGGHILVYAIPGEGGSTEAPNRAINFVWYRNYPSGAPIDDLMLDRNGRQRTTTMPPGTVRPEHIDEMRTTARESIAPTLLEVILGCEDPLIQAVYELESPQLAFGRVGLLGDAAATLRPHVAAGQAKACADAWALRDALKATDGRVVEALSAFESTQLELARSAGERTRAMGMASQFQSTMVPGDPDWRFGLWEPGN